MNGKKDSLFIWSGNWYIENDQAWFVAGECNVLCRLDMNTGQCKFVTELPNNTAGAYMFNCYCVKCNNDIFCMPYRENDSIWIYQIENSEFKQIKIADSDITQGEPFIRAFWKYDEKIFAVSSGWKQILEINIRNKKVENYYSIGDKSDVETAKSIKVGQAIYSVSCLTNEVYEFDMVTKKTVLYTIPNTEKRLYAIGYDGKNFWLSGYSKKIYAWNKEDNTVTTIEKFPEKFGIYNFNNDGKTLIDYNAAEYDTPVFIDIIAMGQYIWFIPLQTNKIIYIDKDTYEISIFDMEGEDETKYSLQTRDIKAKYSLQYIRSNRYIGLFSYKNNNILEIDGYEKTVESKNYSFDERFWQNMKQIYDNQGKVLYDRNNIDNLFFRMKLLDDDSGEKKKLSSNVGENIHREIMLLDT